MDALMIKNILMQFFTAFTQFGLKLLGAIFIIFIGFKLTKLITKRFRENKKMSETNPTVHGFAASFLNISLKILIVIAAAAVVGFPTASFIAVLGSAGVAIGLALQGSLSNIAGGLILIIFKPFRVGDAISLENETGTVQEIGIFFTKILTPDNRTVIFPNSVVSNEKMVNISANHTRRADLLFSVSYDADINTVKKILTDCTKECTYILKEPETMIFLSDQAESALIFSVYAWCECENYLALRSDLTERVKKAFDANNITIPFPQLDVHINQ